MNANGCANCRLHGWKQLENEDDLLTCKRCKLIKYDKTLSYCGKECQAEHWKILYDLLIRRLDIWQNRKIYPQPEYFRHDYDPVVIELDVYHNIERNISLADPFELWKTIDVVHKIGVDEGKKRMLNSFKDPLTTLPIDLRNLVSMALNNTAKFTAMANQVLEALAYQMVLKMICGGSLKQTCSLCSKEVIITGIGILDLNGPVVFFDYLFMGMFVCGVGDCRARKNSMREDLVKLGMTMISAMLEREATRCDFCLLLSPADDEQNLSAHGLEDSHGGLQGRGGGRSSLEKRKGERRRGKQEMDLRKA